MQVSLLEDVKGKRKIIETNTTQTHKEVKSKRQETHAAKLFKSGLNEDSSLMTVPRLLGLNTLSDELQNNETTRCCSDFTACCISSMQRN